VYSNSSPSPSLYCVEIKRHPRDLGLSIVFAATSKLAATQAVLRLYPEYKHSLVLMDVYRARWVEVDFDSGRTIVVKRQRFEVPPCLAAGDKPERKKLPRIEEEGGVQ
jgi:hypothetical protein